jgi:AcrR family transcriptional regulator
MVARQMLEEGGKGSLSLRAIALRAGSALGTIYHHYDSKHALLAGLAIEGFEDLSRRMQRALADRGETGSLRAAGYAYISFLCERPALYQLMFEAVDEGRRPDVLAAENKAFGIIAEAVQGSPIAAAATVEVVENVALAIWAWGRGIAAMGFARGEPGAEPQRRTVEAALQGLEAIFSW